MEKLNTDFPQANYTLWLEQLKKDLKTDDLSKILSSRVESLEVQNLGSSEANSESLFVGHLRRPHHPEFAFANDWEKGVILATDDLLVANKSALQHLEQGASALCFEGIGISNQEELILTLRGVLPEAVSLHFDCGEGSPALLFMLADEFARRPLKRDLLTGSVTFDIPGQLLRTGAFFHDQHTDFSVLNSMIDQGKAALPRFKFVVHDARIYAESGASVVQELAFSLAAFAEYAENLYRGENPEAVLEAAQIRLSIGSDYFLQLAKFRAMRLLWAMLLEAYKLDATKLPLEIEAITTLRNKTIADPYTNLIRATTESMAAVMAGVDRLFVLPHDVLYAQNTANSRRLALNIQHLLQEESRLDKVLDPASGSWYIDGLTRQLVEQSWALFCRVQELGGFFSAVRTGFMQEEIRKSAGELRKMVMSRKRPIVGTSVFAEAHKNLPEALPQTRDPLSKIPEVKQLEPWREAEAFERLRRHLHRHFGKKAFLVCFGEASKSAARAGFAADFLALAGIVSVRGNRNVNPEDQLQSRDALNAGLIVLCAGDDDYLPLVEELFPKARPDAPVWVAGKPADEPRLKALGIQQFIFIGCNVESVFAPFLEQYSPLSPNA